MPGITASTGHTILKIHQKNTLSSAITAKVELVKSRLQQIKQRSHILNPILPQPGRLLTVLILTIIVEFFVYIFLALTPVSTAAVASIIINGITNPLINLIYYTVYDNVLVLESAVVFVETFMILALFNMLGKKIGLVSAALLSLIANLASYFIASGITQSIYGSVTVEE